MSLQPGWDKTEQVNGVTTIFGYNENAVPTDSAIPWVFDDWFHGDQRTDRPAKFSDAMVDKTPSLEEYPNENFPAWRMNADLRIGFNTPDGKTIPDNEWEVSPDSCDMAVVTLEEEGTNPFRNQFDHYDDKFPGEYHYGKVKKHSAKKKLDAPINGIDGVRGSLIYGGSDPYLLKAKRNAELWALMNDVAGDDIPAIISNYLLHVATFYTFIDFVFMADGTKLVRMWDASRYPAHALYLDGTKEAQNVFREGVEWNTDTYLDHSAFLQFGLDENLPGRTPFGQLGSLGYRNLFRKGGGDHPVGTAQARGNHLTVKDVEDALPNPLFPPSIDNPSFF